MKSERTNITDACVAAVCLLVASVPWAAPAVSDAMDEYRQHCYFFSDPDPSLEACAALVGRLEALAQPSREARLALANAKMMIDRSDDARYAREQFCPEVRAILADHPNYAEALYEASHCTGGDRGKGTELLKRALEIEPGNFNALFALLFGVHGPAGYDDLGIDPVTLGSYREALYQASRERVAWNLSAAPADFPSAGLWDPLFLAARYIYDAAMRSRDAKAAAAIQARLRRDAGLDDLDYPARRPCDVEFDRSRPYVEPVCRGGRADHLALACGSLLVTQLDLADVCVRAIERLAGDASAAGLGISDLVLAAVEHTTRDLRHKACGPLRLSTMSVRCYGRQATETATVARLRAVLEHHGGHWTPEHRRVHAMGFLGDGERLDALREVLRDDPANDRARCDLARAVADRGDYAAAGRLLGPDGDPDCLIHGFTLLDREDFLANQATRRKSPLPRLSREEVVKAAGLGPNHAAD